jgi:hypothetical protein
MMSSRHNQFLTLAQNTIKLGRRQDGLFVLLAALEEHLSSSKPDFRRLPRSGD